MIFQSTCKLFDRRVSNFRLYEPKKYIASEFLQFSVIVVRTSLNARYDYRYNMKINNDNEDVRNQNDE